MCVFFLAKNAVKIQIKKGINGVVVFELTLRAGTT